MGGPNTPKYTTAVDLFCGPQIHKIHSEFSPTPNTQNTDITPRVTVVTSAVASRHGPAPGAAGPGRGRAPAAAWISRNWGGCVATIQYVLIQQYNTIRIIQQYSQIRRVLSYPARKAAPAPACGAALRGSANGFFFRPNRHLSGLRGSVSNPAAASVAARHAAKHSTAHRLPPLCVTSSSQPEQGEARRRLPPPKARTGRSGRRELCRRGGRRGDGTRIPLGSRRGQRAGLNGASEGRAAQRRPRVDVSLAVLRRVKVEAALACVQSPQTR